VPELSINLTSDYTSSVNGYSYSASSDNTSSRNTSSRNTSFENTSSRNTSFDNSSITSIMENNKMKGGFSIKKSENNISNNSEMTSSTCSICEI
jgi:hypothetical protein